MLTTDFVSGAPNWIDLGSPDVVAAADFYARVLGWTHVPLGPEAGGYGFFAHDGRTVAAVGPLSEPGGAEFAVWQAGDLLGVDAVSSVGALTWTELHSPAADVSSFYRKVFSWDVVTIEGAPGAFFRPAGTGTGRLFGAVVPDSSAYWLPYFEVADPDQAAGAAEVVVEPYELDGIGRVAVLADPFGARFGVMRSSS